MTKIAGQNPIGDSCLPWCRDRSEEWENPKKRPRQHGTTALRQHGKITASVTQQAPQPRHSFTAGHGSTAPRQAVRNSVKWELLLEKGEANWILKNTQAKAYLLSVRLAKQILNHLELLLGSGYGH